MEPFFLLILNLFLFLLVQGTADKFSKGAFHKSLLNPIFFIGFLQILSAVQFVTIFGEDVIEHPRFYFRATQSTALQAFFTFTMFNAALSIGICFGVRLRCAGRPLVAAPRPLPIAVLFWILILFSLGQYIFALKITSLSDLVMYTSSRFTSSQDAPLLGYLLSTLKVFSAAFILAVGRRQVVFGCFALIAVMLASGARLNVLAVLISIGVVAVLRGMTISRWWILLLPGFTLGSLTMRFLSRARLHFDDMGMFLTETGGITAHIMNPLEFGNHQVLAAFMSPNYASQIDRFPGESLLALLLLPVPREIAPFKGRSISSDFSEYIAPNLWADTQSQATGGVISELYLEFGMIAGSIICFIMGAIFAYAFKKALNSGSDIRKVITVTVLILCAFVFVRTGIVQFGMILWPTLCIVAFLSVTKKSSSARHDY